MVTGLEVTTGSEVAVFEDVGGGLVGSEFTGSEVTSREERRDDLRLVDMLLSKTPLQLGWASAEVGVSSEAAEETESLWGCFRGPISSAP